MVGRKEQPLMDGFIMQSMHMCNMDIEICCTEFGWQNTRSGPPHYFTMGSEIQEFPPLIRL